ncbi:hypothetical protein C5B96_03530 [Subtercola sp. Z020]|uniref:HNH endonuclease signature motif containing protein n=1 Tax=Subtercola sp. Z020 TaxID=2080582 RepID=UPI000CE935EC|nr:HNH endonuclease signature motif containing protein [Subtercola sp. Z020]PPF87863.1 hypothetical protein C5B96_03530 [Subtercola sp. Z020]
MQQPTDVYYLDPAADGMAYLTHYIPAVEAVAIYNRATDLARSAKNAGDERTLTQLRVDTLSDLLVNGETSIPTVARGIRARVTVTVPVLTLLGVTDPVTTDFTAADASVGQNVSLGHPGLLSGSAWLDGYGPIDRHTALKLTRSAPSFGRVLTDRVNGRILSYGRERYKPPAELDDLIRQTHRECTFPLCGDSSATADLDHTVAWNDGGETSFSNLSPLCSSHHKVKHHTDWLIEQSPGGTITWTSPAGFAYLIEPSQIAHPSPTFSDASAPPHASTATREPARERAPF